MNFCNYIFFAILFLSVNQAQQEFVKFLPESTNIEKSANIIKIEMFFKIEDGYHIQAEDEVPENIIPTSVEFQDAEGFEVLKYSFRIPEYERIVLGSEKHKVISGIMSVIVEINTFNRAPDSSLQGELTYQACDEKQCFFPRSLMFEVKL